MTWPNLPLRRHKIILLALAMLVACTGLFVDRHPLDFHVYLLGGDAAWDGRSLYGSDVLIRQYGFTYPPFAGLLFAPLAQLPYAVALIGFTLLSLFSLAVTVRLCAPDLVERLRRPGDWPAVAAIAVLVVCEPVRATLWDGQINLVLMALVVTDVLVLGRTRWCGLLTGVATAVKLTPGIVVVYLLATGRYRAAATAATGFVAATGLGWIVRPSDSHDFWFHNLTKLSGIGDQAKSSNLAGVLLRADHGAPKAVWLLLAVAVAVAGLAMARRVSLGGDEGFALGIVGVTGCLISPVTWTHHWVWVIPWLAGLYRSPLTKDRAGRTVFGIVVAVIVLLNLVPPRIAERWAVTGWLNQNALTLCALAIAALAALRRQRQEVGGTTRR